MSGTSLWIIHPYTSIHVLDSPFQSNARESQNASQKSNLNCVGYTKPPGPFLYLTKSTGLKAGEPTLYQIPCYDPIGESFMI